MTTEIEQAVNTLKQALKDDPDYAYSWHCNIAMMCYDSIRDHTEPCVDIHALAHKIGNDAATRFMSIAFDAKTEFIDEPKPSEGR